MKHISGKILRFCQDFGTELKTCCYVEDVEDKQFNPKPSKKEWFKDIKHFKESMLDFETYEYVFVVYNNYFIFTRNQSSQDVNNTLDKIDTLLPKDIMQYEDAHIDDNMTREQDKKIFDNAMYEASLRYNGILPLITDEERKKLDENDSYDDTLYDRDYRVYAINKKFKNVLDELFGTSTYINPYEDYPDKVFAVQLYDKQLMISMPYDDDETLIKDINTNSLKIQ